MISRTHLVIGLGEVLWDFLPSGKQLGGAPANFAHAAALLGDESVIASRIGTDKLGDEIVSRLAQVSLSSDFLQRDAGHPTGQVKVTLDSAGQPEYDIVEPVAWDFMEWTPGWQALAQRADAVCFGSLAQRSSQSCDTIRKFLEAMRPHAARVFDVNLRQSFYSTEVISESMKLASIVKVNDHELPIVADLLRIKGTEDDSVAHALCCEYSLEMVCVTKGEQGSLLVTVSESDEHKGFKVRLADTVGAGDAFTAGLVHEYLRGSTISQMNKLANRMGAWVSSEFGGMPQPHGDLESILAHSAEQR